MNSITELVHDGNNARRHNPRNIGMIINSLQHVGAARSIVIDENGTILAGNATVEAAIEAGIQNLKVVDADGETIVAVRRSGLTDAQKTMLALYDNRAAELADWDALQVLNDLPDDATFLWSEGEVAALQAVAAQQALEEFPFMDHVGAAAGGAVEEAEARQRARYALAVVLDAEDKRRWDACKERLGVCADTEALLALLAEWETR